MSLEDYLNSSGRLIERVFRHIIPGLLVLGFAWGSNPGWFDSIDISSPWHLLFLATLGIVVGNTWSIIHKLTFHQFLDWVLWMFLSENLCQKLKDLPRNGGWKKMPHWDIRCKKYSDWLAGHIEQFYELEGSHPGLADHVKLRSSQVILMYIAAESYLILTCLSAEQSVIAQWYCVGVPIALVMLLTAVCQQWVQFALDVRVVHNFNVKSTAGPSTP